MHETHFDERERHLCSICNASFSLLSNLNQHIANVHQMNQQSFKYKCQYCEKQFPTPSKLARHHRIHANALLICPELQCLKRFDTLSKFLEHDCIAKEDKTKNTSGSLSTKFSFENMPVLPVSSTPITMQIVGCKIISQTSHV